MSPVSVAIVNDHELIVRGVNEMLRPHADRVKVVELDVGGGGTSVDVSLYDSVAQSPVNAPDLDDLLASATAGRVVVYSWNVQPVLVEQALAKGCGGYLGKDLPAEQLITAIEQIHAGQLITPPSDLDPEAVEPVPDWPGREQGLAAREAEMLTLLIQGLTNEEMAERAQVSRHLVTCNLRRAYQRIGLTRRSEALRWGMQHGLLADHLREPEGPAGSEPP